MRLIGFIILIILYLTNSGEYLYPQENIFHISPSDIIIENPGSPFNSDEDDYNASFIPGLEMISFTSNREGSIYNQRDKINSHDIWIVNYDTSFGLGDPININLLMKDGVDSLKFLNSGDNEGSFSYCSFFNCVFFVVCGGRSDCNLFLSFLNKGKFSEIYLLVSLSTMYFESQPFFSKYDSTLYFVSNRPKIKEFTFRDKNSNDIYLWSSKFDVSLKSFQEPVIHEEFGICMFPYFSPDGKRFYFASKKLKPNFGGFDIYCKTYNPISKEWSEPENIGEPFNSDEDDMTIFIMEDGRRLLISSKRTDIKNRMKGYDNYLFTLPRSILE